MPTCLIHLGVRVSRNRFPRKSGISCRCVDIGLQEIVRRVENSGLGLGWDCSDSEVQRVVVWVSVGSSLSHYTMGKSKIRLSNYGVVSKFQYLGKFCTFSCSVLDNHISSVYFRNNSNNVAVHFCSFFAVFLRCWVCGFSVSLRLHL